ncbi:MAG TPA: CRISPR-associated endonuclease Cas1 [Candidatus Binataceae bacterium]|nr:CRISPR-associated endonuclease Cas1 [Candidatus Binataceae bacterium]
MAAAKIRNKRTLLHCNHIEPPALALAQLKRYAQAATNAEELSELLGIEGNAAHSALITARPH